jgi:phasin family protein
MLTVDQIVASQKAAFGTAFGVTSQLFGRMESLVALNVATAKAALESAAEHTAEALSVKDPQAFIALQTGTVQPAAEKVLAYTKEVIEIGQGASSDLAKAFEAEAAKLQAQTTQWFDTAAKNAPAGFDGVFTLGKSVLDAQQRAATYAQDAATKAAGLFESAVKQATASTATVTEIGTKPASRRK